MSLWIVTSFDVDNQYTSVEQMTVVAVVGSVYYGSKNFVELDLVAVVEQIMSVAVVVGTMQHSYLLRLSAFDN